MKSKKIIHDNEARRLSALERYRIVDTEAEEGFDRITRTAAAYFNTPIALVSLVDETRQWFKSKYGLDVSETPREIAFCVHTIAEDRTMIVKDTLQDHRFADSPLVLGDPNIRFYAGTPLRTHDGENLGTLCVIDRIPREFSEAEEKVLQDLSGLVIDQLELRLANLKAEEELERHTRNIGLLRDNQTRLNAIFNSTYDGILILDKKGEVESHNLAAEQLFGYNSSELLGLHARILMPDSFDTKVAKFFAEHPPSGVSNYFIDGDQENIAVKKNGERFPVEMSVSEIALNDERHFCLIGRDISAKKRTEKKLVNAIAVAEKSNSSQLALLSKLSHELLTPLNAIMGFSEFLLTDIEKILTINQRGHFQQIIEGGRQLTEITKQILEYSRLASRSQYLQIEEFPITPVINKCWDTLKSLAAEKKIQFQFTSVVSKDVIVKADKESLTQVITKLLANAIKYNKANGRITVSISLSQEGLAIIAIEDTGIGIANSKIPHLFEILRHPKTREVEEYSINLALCRAILHGMNGSIDVESTLELGSTFYLKIPADTQAEFMSSDGTSLQARRNANNRHLSDKKSILYIADNAAQVKKVKNTLESKQGLSLECATRGPLALVIAIQHTPDLILLDTQLAEIEVHHLLLRLREHPKTSGIPVLLICPPDSLNQDRRLSLHEGYETISSLEIDSSLLPVIDKILKES